MVGMNYVRYWYPYASAEREYPNTWVVWSISRERQKETGAIRGLWGLSDTEEGAWKDAEFRLRHR